VNYNLNDQPNFNKLSDIIQIKKPTSQKDGKVVLRTLFGDDLYKIFDKINNNKEILA
jgi:hypothetical protein